MDIFRKLALNCHTQELKVNKFTKNYILLNINDKGVIGLFYKQ